MASDWDANNMVVVVVVVGNVDRRHKGCEVQAIEADHAAAAVAVAVADIGGTLAVFVIDVV